MVNMSKGFWQFFDYLGVFFIVCYLYLVSENYWVNDSFIRNKNLKGLKERKKLRKEIL